MFINSTASSWEGDKTQLALENGQLLSVTAAIVTDHLFAGRVHLECCSQTLWTVQLCERVTAGRLVQTRTVEAEAGEDWTRSCGGGGSFGLGNLGLESVQLVDCGHVIHGLVQRVKHGDVGGGEGRYLAVHTDSAAEGELAVLSGDMERDLIRVNTIATVGTGLKIATVGFFGSICLNLKTLTLIINRLLLN